MSLYAKTPLSLSCLSKLPRTKSACQISETSRNRTEAMWAKQEEPAKVQVSITKAQASFSSIQSQWTERRRTHLNWETITRQEALRTTNEWLRTRMATVVMSKFRTVRLCHQRQELQMECSKAACHRRTITLQLGKIQEADPLPRELCPTLSKTHLVTIRSSRWIWAIMEDTSVRFKETVVWTKIIHLPKLVSTWAVWFVRTFSRKMVLRTFTFTSWVSNSTKNRF